MTDLAPSQLKIALQALAIPASAQASLIRDTNSTLSALRDNFRFSAQKLIIAVEEVYQRNEPPPMIFGQTHLEVLGRIDKTLRNLWHDGAFRSERPVESLSVEPHWDEVREAAKSALQSFGWPLEVPPCGWPLLRSISEIEQLVALEDHEHS